MIQYLQIGMYADDTVIYCSGPNTDVVSGCLQADLDLVCNWLNCNRLQLNVGKTKSMLFRNHYYRGNTELKMQVNNVVLEQVNSYKYLGIMLDQNLNFNMHVDYMCNKTRKKLGMLKRVRKYITIDTALLLYKTLVVPLFDYGDIVYISIPPWKI